MTPTRGPASFAKLLRACVLVALVATTGAGCSSPVTAFSVSDLSVAPNQTEILTGDEVVVTARVVNTGTLAGTYEAALRVDGSIRSEMPVELGIGESTTVRFHLEAGPPADYEIQVGPEIASLRVTAVAEFRVSALTVAPTTEEILTGDDVLVTAHVENSGTVAGTYDAALRVNGSLQSEQEVELDAGESTTMQFRFRAGSPGDYEVRLGEARAVITVPAPAAFELGTLELTPNPASAGEPLDVAVSLTNSGGTTGTHAVRLSIDGKVAETQEATLAGGQATTVYFSIAAPGAGTHTVAVDELQTELLVWKLKRLANGTLLVNKVKGGMGRLTIKNGDDRDAVVVLAKSSKPGKALLAVYLRANKSRTIRGIKDGTYAVYFSLGKGWDTYSKAFTRSQEHNRFEDTIRFTTKRTSTRITYKVWTISLRPVVGGNAPSDRIGEDDFPTVN